jgi:hypothetical protein
MEAATEEGITPDIDLITELNGAFHGAIVTVSGNSLLPGLGRGGDAGARPDRPPRAGGCGP